MVYLSANLLPVLSQSALTLLALTGVALVPPSTGSVTLIPLFGATPGTIVDTVRANGGTIVATTSLGIVAHGRRQHLFGPLLASGVLPIRATAAECGR